METSRYASILIPLVFLTVVIWYLVWRERVRQRKAEENRRRWREEVAQRPETPPPGPPKAPARESVVTHRFDNKSPFPEQPRIPTPTPVYDPLNPLNPLSPISPFNDSYRQDPSPSDYTCRDVGYGGGTGDSSPSSCDSPSTSSFD